MSDKLVIEKYDELQTTDPLLYKTVVVVDPDNVPIEHTGMGTQACYRYCSVDLKWVPIDQPRHFEARWPTDAQLREILGGTLFDDIQSGKCGYDAILELAGVEDVPDDELPEANWVEYDIGETANDALSKAIDALDPDHE